MALIGRIIKTGIDLTDKFRVAGAPAVELQREQLLNLLEKASETSFGKYYGFSDLLDHVDPEKAFKERVPIHEYSSINERWWLQQRKFPDITWPGKPRFFALSSGTTGAGSKRIPITEDFLGSMRSVGRAMIRNLSRFDLPEELFESEILMLSSSADLGRNAHGFLEGEISGINVSNFPDWYEIFYRPGKEIASIADWDKRVKRIAEEAPNWNIGGIAGIPGWVLLMLRKVLEVNGVSSIHEIWPNFSVFASGGVAYDTYRKDFDALCSKPITVMDTYLASEGFVAFTARPGTLAMELALEHGYFFEFIPFDERGVDERGSVLEDPVSLSIDEVKTGEEYVLVLSSCAGAWRYVIGDVIRFVGTDPPEILITGRTKFFLNVAGSQLTEERMDKAIIEVGEEFDISINEYMVAAMKDESGAYTHQWVLVADHHPDETQVARSLDEHLKEANRSYRGARKKNLSGVGVEFMTKAEYTEYLEASKQKGGQVKTPKVMDAERMESLLRFRDRR
jgi:hypothetical protein